MINHSELQKSLAEDKKKPTIFFDIDDTLATHSHLEADEKLYICRKSMLIIAQEREHKVLPGVIELMQLLFSNPLVQVAFFSSAPKARNVEFIKALLTKALCEKKFCEMIPSNIILSKEDLTTISKYQADQMYTNFGLYCGNYKKNIFQIVSDESSKKQIILVDDDSSYIQFGQQANFLKSPCGHTEYYNQMKKVELEEVVEKYMNSTRFYKYNTIFYLAAALTNCIDAFSKGLDVTKLLFEMQFTKISDPLFRFKPDYKCIKDKTYYEKGLAILKSVNPKLSFVSREDYMDTISAEPTELEISTIAEAKSKQASEDVCCIM